MNDQLKAKAAVELLPKIEAALYGENDLTNGEVVSVKTALELPRPVAEGTHGVLNILLLKKYGYAKGNYASICVHCDQMKNDMDKRAVCCLECAMIKAAKEGE
jgi:hypothetical protein